LKHLLPLITLLFIVCAQTLNSQDYHSIKQHERPPIALYPIPLDAFEAGKMLIKIREDLHYILPDVQLMAHDRGFVSTGISNLDVLNELFMVDEYNPFFSSLYHTNYEAHLYRERHKAWGFHLWFELTLHSTTDIIDAVLQFRGLEEIEFAEPVY